MDGESSSYPSIVPPLPLKVALHPPGAKPSRSRRKSLYPDKCLPAWVSWFAGWMAAMSRMSACMHGVPSTGRRVSAPKSYLSPSLCSTAPPINPLAPAIKTFCWESCKTNRRLVERRVGVQFAASSNPETPTPNDCRMRARRTVKALQKRNPRDA